MKSNQFIKTLLTFFIGSVLSKLVSFFLLPIYTKHLTPSQFGEYDLVFSFINLIAPIAFFQIWDGIFRYSFDYKGIKDKYKVISNGVIIIPLGLFIYLILFFILNYFYNFNFFLLILVYGFVFAIHYFHIFSVRVFLNNKLFIISGFVSTLLTAVSNILLIVVFGFGVEAIYISAILGLLLQIIIIEIKIGVFINFRRVFLDKKIIKDMLRFSIALSIATVSYWLLSGYTKILIKGFVGDDGNGLFAVANRFASLITIVVTIFQYAWNETAYLMADETIAKKRNRYNTIVNFIMLSIICSVGVLIILIKIIFPYLIDSKYYLALSLIPFTIVGVVANSFASFLGTIFMSEKDNKIILKSTLIASVFNIIAGYFATKYFGIEGANVVLAISFLILAVIRLIKVKSRYQLHIDTNRLMLAILILSISFIIFKLFDSELGLAISFIILCLFIIVILKKYILEFIKTVFKKRKHNI